MSGLSYLSPIPTHNLRQVAPSSSSPLRHSVHSPPKLVNPERTKPLHYRYSPEKAGICLTESMQIADYLNKPTVCRNEVEETYKLLKDIIFLERELESSKIELTLKPDFNLLDAFRLLD